MRIALLLTFILMLAGHSSKAQMIFNQYFDGADTAAQNSIIIMLDTSGTNVWQIGKPQKIVFDSAATYPNALITDTVNPYPPNASSSFRFKLAPDNFGPYGILALQWKQKLDMDQGTDGGIIEYSIDSGSTWNNVFNSPYVYNFYGYDQANADTLVTGEYSFSGTDGTWRDIWLCFDLSWMAWTAGNDTVEFRFTLKSDSLDFQREGWVIDNMSAHLTWAHTVKQGESSKYMNVYPSITDGIVHIEAQKLQEFHIIESIELIDMQGRIVKHHGVAPTKFYIDIKDQSEGMYYLRVKTNKKLEVFPIVLKKN